MRKETKTSRNVLLRQVTRRLCDHYMLVVSSSEKNTV